MRIIAGAKRGLRLAAVGAGDADAHLRPTSDRVRENLFNILTAHDDPIRDARVLDLFAGTGALGFEALSRGAAHVTFVDDGAKAKTLIRENSELMGPTAHGATRFYRHDATRLGANRDAAFSLVFLDPPYGKGLGARALESAVEGGWLAPGALVVWEENSAQMPLPGFQPKDYRRYGETHITILRYAE